MISSFLVLIITVGLTFIFTRSTNGCCTRLVAYNAFETNQPHCFWPIIIEQSALMSMVVEAAGRVAAQRSAGSLMTQIDMQIPEIVIQRMREPDFNSQMLARWIGRRWDLPEKAIAELYSKGRGCSPRICLSVTSRSIVDDTCCPFG